MPNIRFTDSPDHASLPLVRVGKLRWQQVPTSAGKSLFTDISVAVYVDTTEFGVSQQGKLRGLLVDTLHQNDLMHNTADATAGYKILGSPRGGWFAHTRANSSATICASNWLSTAVEACDKHWEPVAKEIKTLLTDRINELLDSPGRRDSISKRQSEEIQELFSAQKADPEPYL